MPELICADCKTLYNVTDEYIAAYQDEGSRCGCGKLFDVKPVPTKRTKVVSSKMEQPTTNKGE